MSLFSNSNFLDLVTIHRDLIERCKKGDSRAQSQLYGQYAKAMFNICLRMVSDRHDAEDVLQHAFIDVFTKLDQFRYESSIGAWIKRIVINNCINFLKKRKLEWIEMNENHNMIMEEIDDTDINFSVSTIHQAMNQLPDGYRVVLSLYLLEGYDHDEIAQILGITESTSKSQYHRAKNRIREIIKDRSS